MYFWDDHLPSFHRHCECILLVFSQYYYHLFRRIKVFKKLRRLSEVLDISYGRTGAGNLQLVRTSIVIDVVCDVFMMVIKLNSLMREPDSFKKLTGIDLEHYWDLCRDLIPIWQQMENERLNRPGRQRAIGAGRKYNLDMKLQLLMLLIHQHLKLTTEATGKLFNVHKSTVSRNTRRVCHALSSLTDGWIDLRGSSEKRKNLAQVLNEQPDLGALLIDHQVVQYRQPQG